MIKDKDYILNQVAGTRCVDTITQQNTEKLKAARGNP